MNTASFLIRILIRISSTETILILHTISCTLLLLWVMVVIILHLAVTTFAVPQILSASGYHQIIDAAQLAALTTPLPP